MRGVHVKIEGCVQGVGYRAWLKSTADALGVHGWVRNRRDGSVEALLHGERECVADVLRACEEGPPAALVTCVDVLEESAGAYDGFDVRPTE